MTGAEADPSTYVRALLALTAVVALLLAGRWVLARHGLAATTPLHRGDGLLVRETLALDARNRLVVVRRGDVELLLAVGPQGVSRLDRLDSRAEGRSPAPEP